MTMGKAFGWGAAIVGAMVIGIALGPSLTDRLVTKTTQPAITERQPTAKPPTQAKPGVAPRNEGTPSKAAKPGVAEEKGAKVAASEPELQARLKPVLNRGANMTVAADGFRDAEQFATVAHAARNTQVPFMLLKHRVLNEKKTLADAIKASKPDIDAAGEVARARSEAKSDIAAIAG